MQPSEQLKTGSNPAMDRRAHLRHPLTLGARMRASGTEVRPCQIRDFCFGGLFLEVEGVSDEHLVIDGRQIGRDDPIMVYFTLPVNGVPRQFDVPVRVARVFSQGVGVAFRDPNPAAIAVLNDVSLQQREGRAPSTGADAAPGLNAGSLLESIRQATLAYLQRNVDRLFKDANENLFAGARDAPSNAEQSAYLDAIKEIEEVQEPVSTSFLDLVEQKLNGMGLQTEVEEEGTDSDRLTLVDTCMFDDWLTVKSIIAKVQTRFQKSQDDLDRRISHLMGVSIAEEDNPVGIAGLALSFHDALQNLAASARARQAVFDAFEATVVDELDLLLDQLNAILVDGGVLPVIKEVKPANPAKPNAKQRVRPPPPAAIDDAGVQHTEGQESGGWDQSATPGEALGPYEPPPGGVPLAHGAPLTGAGGEVPGGYGPPPAGGAPPGYGHPPTSGAPSGYGHPPASGAPAGYGYPPPVGAPAAPGGPATPGFRGGHGTAAPPGASAVPGPQHGYGVAPGPPGATGGMATGPGLADSLVPGSIPGQAMPANQGVATPYMPYWSPMSGRQTQGFAAGQPAQGPSYGDSGHPPAAPDAGPVGDYELGSRELGVGQGYQAARNLLGLSRYVGGGGPGGVGGGPGSIAAMGSPSRAAVASDEMMGALTNLQRSAEFNDAERTGPLSLRERLVARLASAGVKVGEAEVEAVDVISHLLDSMVADPMINDGVKGRIKRLAIPLLKAALHDEQFFDDLDHPARQVVNRLGRVELPVSSKAGYRGATIVNDVDPLLDRIVDRYDRDSHVFAEALPELDALIQRQLQDYVEKVQCVVEERGKQQALMNTLRKGKTDEVRSPAAAAKNLPEEWRQWLARAKQLAVGDAVSIDSGSGAPQPASLAWVAEDQNTFLFVDGQGEKAASLTLQELAMGLRRGTTKPIDSVALPLMDRGFYRMLEGMHTKLTDDVNKDPVTGLLTRKAFVTHLRHVLAGASQEGWDHVLCHLDIDGFTEIDTRCGRKAGNGLLKKFSKVLAKHVSDGGVAARLQADDFAMLLEHCSTEEALQLVERLRQSIEKSRVIWQGETLAMSISVGLVAVDGYTEGPRGLMEAAQAACDQAKEAGGNRVHVLDDESSPPGSQDDTAAVRETTPIPTLIEQGLVVLRHQRISPIGEDLPDKPYFEVLLGLHKNGDYVAIPADLVQAAERANEMRDVDRWVINTAFKWMAANRRKLMKIGGYAITLSGNTLCDDELLEYVLAQFNETKVPPGKIMFEVTETAAIDSLSVAVGFIRTMKEYGCRFALDDFGAGHASYSYLKTLPVDYLKMDGLFVKDIADNRNDFAMVKSMNDIAHVLGKQTIAEYVDSDEILDRLREIGVDYAQGHIIDLPQLLTTAD